MEPADWATHVILERVHRRLIPGREVRPIRLEWYPYVDVRSTMRERDGTLLVRLSDHLMTAPERVLEGVFSILVCRLYQIPVDRADPKAVEAYQRYLYDPDLQARRRKSRRRRGRKHIDPQGQYRSLVASFLRVNLDMNLVLPEAPRLSWSKTASRRRFGHYDPDHDCIVISRALDDLDVPAFVLDFVVYHELLHILHPVEEGGGGKRRVHPPAFQEAEAKFPQRDEAEAWLKRLAAG